MKKPHHHTIDIQWCEILQHTHFAGEQHLLRLHAPEIATQAKAGSFVHVTCDKSRPLRRPISIMRTSPHGGWIELLYKVFGEGTRLLAQRSVGEKLSIMGPIGTPFKPHMERSRPLLIGGGVGLPPMVFLADSLREIAGAYQPMVIMGSEVPFPFELQRSTIEVAGQPEGVNAAMPLLEQWGIPSRLASQQGYAGTFRGYVTDLARCWLDGLTDAERQQVEIFSCGPHPMLEAVAALAKEYRIPCQVSMEEFMACGVGGCAGCVIEVQTDKGPQMKRVCVDGPVFDARAVFG